MAAIRTLLDDALKPKSREHRVRRNYELVSISNDALIAIWFIIGSILFFSESTSKLGTWLFLIGSVELLIRPVIRLSRHIHLGQLHGPSGDKAQVESSQDF